MVTQAQMRLLKREPPEISGGSLGYQNQRLSWWWSPGSDYQDNHHYGQRRANTDYGVNPDRSYLLRRRYVDYWWW